jgi:hypothetical protein
MALNPTLRRNLMDAILADPRNAREVIQLATEALDEWERSVRSSIDHRADWGISSSLGLPRYKSGGKWLDVENHQHRTFARMTAVGWNLHNRHASSRVEEDLVRFVREADAVDPTAVPHYRTILDAPEMVEPPPYALWSER